MARFLTDDDYKKQIRNEILNAVTQDDNGLVIQAENAAMAEVEGYLSKRYDMGSAWAAAGDNRNPLLIMYLIDITVFHLYSMLPNKQIPTNRENRYLGAKDYFESIAKGLLTISLPKIKPASLTSVNTGARIVAMVGTPAAISDTIQISVNGTVLFSTITFSTVMSQADAAEYISAAINANNHNTDFSAMAGKAGMYTIILPESLGHLGNNANALITTTGNITCSATPATGGVTKQIEASTNPQSLRIGSTSRKFNSDF